MDLNIKRKRCKCKKKWRANLDALHEVLELGADERVAGVGGVDVEPGTGLLANGPDLGQIVEGHARSGAQRGRHEEGHQTHGAVLLHGLGQRGAAQAQLLVRVQDAQLDERDHGRLLDARVRLFRTVGDQLGQQHALLDERVHRLQLLDLLGPRRQQRHQHALARRRLVQFHR